MVGGGGGQTKGGETTVRTDQIDYEAAVGAASGGFVEVGFAVRREVHVGNGAGRLKADKVSGIGEGIAEDENRGIASGGVAKGS